MKTVLFVSHSAGFVGAEKFLYDVVMHLDQSKYNALVCCPKFGAQILCDRLKGNSHIRVFGLPYKSAVSVSPNLFRRVANALSHIIGTVLILQLIKKEKVDIVFSNTSWVCVGGFAARLGRVPHVWFIHEALGKSGAQFILGNNLYKRIIGWLSSVVVVNSQWTFEQYKKFINGGKLRIKYYGFDFLNKTTKKYNPRELVFSGEIHLGIAGTITEHKGQLEAVKALEILSSADIRFKLLIFGQVTNTEYCNEVRRYVVDNNLSEKVSFEDFVVNISDMYSKIDILLVPSKVEPFGKVVVEGIFFGCIVIAASVGGIREIIQHNENGILLENTSPDLIAKIVLSVVNNEKLVARIRKNALQSISKYALDSMMSDIDGLLEEVAKVGK